MNSLKRLHIAYLSVNDPLDKRSWSGITYYLAKTLERNVGDVDVLGPVEIPWRIDKFLRAIAKLIRILFRKEYVTKYSLVRARYAAKVLQKRLEKGQYDLIVAPASSDGVAFLKTKIPILYMSDTTFRLISNYYTWEFKNMPALSKKEGEYLENHSLKKSSLMLYTSHWAASSAIKDYGVPEEKIAVITMGANMDQSPDRSLIFEKEKNPRLTLLYLAVEWQRKGGPIAFEAMKALLAKGMDVKLIICGCVPPAEFSHPNMEVIPFLNKNVKEDQQKFVEVLSTSHFLLLPTRADCSLLVACESNSYGMPAISTDTGGVSDVVKDGINGYCLPYDVPGANYADLIADIYNDKKRYSELIRTSRLRYEEKLNWDKFAEQLKTALEKIIK